MPQHSPSPADDAPADFGSWLRQARSARDLTQEALAEAVGCAVQTIRSLEIGRRRPSREMAARIVDLLQTPAAEREPLIRLARAPLDRAAPTPAPVASLSPAAPPALADALIGRQAELQHLQHALLADDRRLVTLLGPGGIGKTRLALQAVTNLAGNFADGAAWAALAPLIDAANLPTAIAAAVGCPLSAAPDPEAALLDFLRDRELLVLDNLEQLLVAEHGERVGALLSGILRAAQGVRLLITSRERLRLRDEWLIELDGLPLPADRPGARVERSAAALLFLERARQVSNDFALNSENRAAVGRICRRLGGLPLAIELAAAWVRSLSCAEIAAELERDPDFLSGSSRDLPARHRSLRTVLDHSWQLLAPDERRLLAVLALFRGGGRRDAIVAAVGSGTSNAATLALLAALVDKSLVRRSLDEDGATRYDLHEFVRQYAAARLAKGPDEAAAIARHAAHYAAWVAGQEHVLKSASQRTAVAAISAEIANLRAAWQWACARRDAAILRQMLPTLDWFYELRGWYSEAAAAFAQGIQSLRPLIEAGDASEVAATCYWLMYGREGFHSLRRDPAFAVARLGDSVAMLRQVSRHGEQINCLKGFAYVNIFAGHYSQAERLLDEACAIAEATSDNWNLAISRVVRGVLEMFRSDAATAREQLVAALAVARPVGDPRPISMALTYLGLISLALGEATVAERCCREALVLAAEHQDRFQMSLSLQALGRLALARSELGEAGWLLDESLAIAREIGDRWLEAQALGCQGNLAARQGDIERAGARHREALAVAARAPLPIALDELLALAALELERRPTAALAALAYIRQHLLTRPAARIAAEQHWAAAAARFAPAELDRAEAAARTLPRERPAALLDSFGQPGD